MDTKWYQTPYFRYFCFFVCFVHFLAFPSSGARHAVDRKGTTRATPGGGGGGNKVLRHDVRNFGFTPDSHHSFRYIAALPATHVEEVGGKVGSLLAPTTPEKRVISEPTVRYSVSQSVSDMLGMDTTQLEHMADLAAEDEAAMRLRVQSRLKGPNIVNVPFPSSRGTHRSVVGGAIIRHDRPPYVPQPPPHPFLPASRNPSTLPASIALTTTPIRCSHSPHRIRNLQQNAECVDQ